MISLSLCVAMILDEQSSSRLLLVKEEKTCSPQRIGIEAVIASLSAYMSNGGSLINAYEEQSGRCFPTREVTYERAQSMLSMRKFAWELGTHVNTMAYALVVSARLSTALGCQATRCLDAVCAVYRRMTRLTLAKDSAFAMPKATIKLLTALPLLTLTFGAALGAHPFTFILHSRLGLCCFLLGVIAYVSGIVWMRVLFSELEQKVGE